MGFFGGIVNDIKKGGIGRALDMVEKHTGPVFKALHVVKDALKTASTFPGPIGKIARKLEGVVKVADAAEEATGTLLHHGRHIDETAKTYARNLAGGDGNVVKSSKIEGHASGPPAQKRIRAGEQSQLPLRDVGSRHPGTMSAYTQSKGIFGPRVEDPHPLAAELKKYIENRRRELLGQNNPITTKGEPTLRMEREQPKFERKPPMEDPYSKLPTDAGRQPDVIYPKYPGVGGVTTSGGHVSQQSLDALKGLMNS